MAQRGSRSCSSPGNSSHGATRGELEPGQQALEEAVVSVGPLLQRSLVVAIELPGSRRRRSTEVLAASLHRLSFPPLSVVMTPAFEQVLISKKAPVCSSSPEARRSERCPALSSSSAAVLVQDDLDLSLVAPAAPIDDATTDTADTDPDPGMQAGRTADSAPAVCPLSACGCTWFFLSLRSGGRG